MILLETGNRILAETVGAVLKPPADVLTDEDQKSNGRSPMDIRLCDFDDVSYRVVIDAADTSVMKVSLNLPCFKQIENTGGFAAAERVYGNLLSSPEQNYDLTLSIPLDPLPASMTPDELIVRLSLFKSSIIGGVFDYYFDALLQGKPQTSSFKFDLRNDTTVFFFPRADRVTVVFSLDFHDKTDSAIAKIFMQEFVDARRRLGSAPPVTFSINPPLELKEYKIVEPTGNLGFITFAVLKSHLEGGRKEKVIAVLPGFRNYLQYHIKCSKSYFHSRMRARVVSLLKILSRAKQEKVEEKQMKTSSGKTFVRS